MHLGNRTFEVDPNFRFNGRNERIKPFVERLNQSRSEGGFKPLSARYVAIAMAHIETEDLDAFYKKLDQSGSFSKLWWWYVKPKKDNKK